jgi:hypothetical protein
VVAAEPCGDAVTLGDPGVDAGAEVGPLHEQLPLGHLRGVGVRAGWPGLVEPLGVGEPAAGVEGYQARTPVSTLKASPWATCTSARR